MKQPKAPEPQHLCSFRLDDELARRLDELALTIARDLGLPKPNRTHAIRLALTLGLPRAEAKFGIK